MINAFELWGKNWSNAYKFYNTKGNLQTKAKLKAKWYNDFMKMFEDIEKEIKSNKEAVK